MAIIRSAQPRRRRSPIGPDPVVIDHREGDRTNDPFGDDGMLRIEVRHGVQPDQLHPRVADRIEPARSARRGSPEWPSSPALELGGEGPAADDMTGPDLWRGVGAEEA